MKVTIKSVIKTSYSQFECFEDQQIIFRAGNSLAIKEIGRPDAEFIPLSYSMQTLLDFKPMTNKRGVFTAEKIAKDIELAMYALNGDRRTVLLALDSAFLGEIEKV